MDFSGSFIKRIRGMTAKVSGKASSRTGYNTRSMAGAKLADAPSAIAGQQQPLIFGESGEEMLGKAIVLTLQALPQDRAKLFERLTREIISIVSNVGSCMRPWTCTVHEGTDGSRIFSGGIGSSVVIDPNGRLWRARTYEDFETTYDITPTSCEIASMTPVYKDMREYLPSGSKSKDEN
jgi:hypothetical protein